MKKAIALMSCISALLSSGLSHVSALGTPSRVAYSSSIMYENVSFDVYQTSNSNITYTITCSGSPTFSFDEFNVNGWLSSQDGNGVRNI